MRGWAVRSSDNQSVMNRIMLRFRPIAPKPVGGDASSGTSEQSRGSSDCKRAKRKYVRVRGRQSKKCTDRKITEGKKRSPPPENSGIEDDESPQGKGKKTLQLLDLGDRSESDNQKSCDNNNFNKSQENWIAYRDNVDDDVKPEADTGGATVDVPTVRSVIETWIIVECVTDKFTGVGFSDKDMIYSLEHDTCPSFVSDWTNNVIWVNDAYKKMAAECEQAAAAVEKGFVVWLVVKEELPHFCPSFACRVRVTQGQKWNKIVPCDVWRLEFAGFAWKLDVNTALSLGI